MWVVTSKGGYPESGEDKKILTLTKNAVLASERNVETDQFRIPADYWALMNNRYKLSKKYSKTTKSEISLESVSKNTNDDKKPSIYKAINETETENIKSAPPKRTPPKRTPPKRTPPKRGGRKTVRKYVNKIK